LIQTCVVACGLVAVFLVLRIEYNDGSGLFSSLWFSTFGKILLNVFTVNHPFVFALIAALYLWWRGISLARSQLYFNNIYTTFSIELATLVFLVILWGNSFKSNPLRSLTSDIGIYIAGFFFFGLAALALANLRVILERIKKKGESSRNFSRRWLTIILSVIGVIVLFGLGFSALFSSTTGAALQRFLNAVNDGYSALVNFVIDGLNYLFGWLNGVFEAIIAWFRRIWEPPNTPATPEGTPPTTETLPKNGSISDNTMLIIKFVTLAIVVGVVVFLIIKAINRRKASQVDDDLEEENESLWSWKGFKADVVVFINMLLQRFRRKPKPVVEDAGIHWEPEEDVQRRLSIREIYQHLLWQGSRLHVPREDFETPSEYARRLGHALPIIQEPLDEITGMYLDVRYGDREAEENKTDAANSFWQTFLNAFKRPDREE
jgi:hypothetical protein